MYVIYILKFCFCFFSLNCLTGTVQFDTNNTYFAFELEGNNYRIRHKMVDYYRILDIPKAATEVEIKKA